MKKFLLLAALAASFSSAYADGFSDIFKLTYDDKAVENGQTIDVKYYFDKILMENPSIADLIPDYANSDYCYYTSQAVLYATNISDEPWKLEFSLSRISPSLDEYPISGSKEIGNFQLCYDYTSVAGTCLNVLPGNTSVESGSDLKDVDPEEHMKMDVEQVQFKSLIPVTFRLDLRITEGGQTISGGNSFVYIIFSHEKDITAAVDGIISDSSAEEYFTLDGLKVTEPQKGNLYIVRKGENVTKRVF